MNPKTATHPSRRIKIAHLLQAETPPPGPLVVNGWVRTKRDAKTFSFIELNDGSCLTNIQIVVDAPVPDYNLVRKITTGSALAVEGHLVPSQGQGQRWEIQATKVRLMGSAPDSYPLQKKRHSDEFLRTIAHLRPRTNKYGAAFRIRSQLSNAVHRFFHERGFHYIHTPILTASDCEGAGELFRVTTLPQESLGYENDFFGVEANLTVSGQLEAEMLALALGDVYTFGPTFRAENSNTRRHAAEFWMIEPEMAFCDLQESMDLAETMLKALTAFALDHCSEDLGLFARFVDKHLIQTLSHIVSAPFARIPYSEAVSILERSSHPFEYPIAHGHDLQSEHERYLVEHHYKKPVIVFDFPKTIKPFYMRLNDDGRTVASMDVLVPGIGEIIGGSQREERFDQLLHRLESLGLSKEKYRWYLESRQYGTAPHSGFGLGFERLVMMITGINNIRDVIPFPRTPKNIAF